MYLLLAWGEEDGNYFLKRVAYLKFFVSRAAVHKNFSFV